MIRPQNRLGHVRQPAVDFDIAIHLDESLTGWLTRSSMDIGVHDWWKFIKALGGDPRGLYDGDEKAIRWLSDKTELPFHVLNQTATVSINHDMAAIRGVRTTKQYALRVRPRYCPHCLHEDRQNGGAPYLRSHWEYAGYEVCHVHRTPLTEQYFVGQPKSCGSLLHRTIKSDFFSKASSRDAVPTSFDEHVHDRIALGENSLFGLDLDELNLLSRDPGLTMMFPGAVKLVDATDEQCHAAAGLGFELLKEGPAFVEGTLEAHINVQLSGLSGNGSLVPRTFLGLLVDRLRKLASQELAVPIVNAARTAIFSTLPIEAGQMVFGKALETRRLHSLTTLHYVTSCGWTGSLEVLRQAGLIDEMTAERLQRAVIVSADAAVSAIREADSSLSIVQAGERLGLSRYPAEDLVSEGLLQIDLKWSRTDYARIKPLTVEKLVRRLFDKAELVVEG